MQRHLATLVAAELLYQRGQPPQAVYMFKHALIQEAAYESVLKRVRRQTHQRILQVLEAQCSETAVTAPALLGYHALRGELWDKALAYFRQAGEHAVGRSANREAVAAFEQALIAVQYLPDSRDTHEQAIDLWLALRTALRPLGDLRRVLACLREAETLATALDDPRRLGWVLIFLSGHFHQRGALAQAITAGERALGARHGRWGCRPPRPGKPDPGHSLRGPGRLSSGHGLPQADAWRPSVGNGGVSALGRICCPLCSPLPPLPCIMPNSACSLRAEPSGKKGCRLPKRLRTPAASCGPIMGMGVLSLRQGDLPRALPLLERAVGICQEADLLNWFPRIAATLGAAYTLTGRVADAVPLLTQAMEQNIAIENVWFEMRL